MPNSDKKCPNGSGFSLQMPKNRPFRVLQLSDLQTIDLTHIRNETRDRQIKGAYFKNGVWGMEERTYAHVRALVKETAPDLIVLAGDNVYGEFDDAGIMMGELIALFEEIGIPWAPLFGNHDNESRMGVRWQCAQLKKAPHCLFERGSVTGNSNYVIRLMEGERPVFALALMDSNGCHEVGTPGAPEEGVTPDNIDYRLLTHKEGIYPDQIAWYEQVVGELPNAVFLHIQLYALIKAATAKYGYTFGEDLEATAPGDTGKYTEHMALSRFCDQDGTFFETLKKHRCRAVFAGHQHNNNAVIEWEGVRLGYGLKTGFSTYWRRGSTGGTLHEITPDGQMTSTHIYRN